MPKQNLRLQNEAIAIENLKDIIEKNNLSKNDQAEAQATLAQAYINKDQFTSCNCSFKKMRIQLQKTNFLKADYILLKDSFIIKMSKKDSANMAFQQVIKLNSKTVMVYRVNAFLEQIHNFDYSNGDLETISELLSDIEENREHRPYLDRIHHTIAKHHLKLNSDSLAITYFNNSLRTNSGR